MSETPHVERSVVERRAIDPLPQAILAALSRSGVFCDSLQPVRPSPPAATPPLLRRLRDGRLRLVDVLGNAEARGARAAFDRGGYTRKEETAALSVRQTLDLRIAPRQRASERHHRAARIRRRL
jgi:hypothetical protein